MVHVIPFGCCIYSGETPGNFCPGSGTTTSEIRKNPPPFKMVVAPLWRKIIQDTLIPTKEEVMVRVKVAIRASAPSPVQFAQNDIYKGLYGPDYHGVGASGITWEWWPSNGRYGIIPLLHPATGQVEFAKFPEVIHTATLPWSTREEKVSWFNQRYPATPGLLGTSWVYNVRNKWFITNPNEDGTKNTTFQFSLHETPSLSLGGDLTRFALAIVKENRGALSIYINNYQTYMQDVSTENQYIRKNVLRIVGLPSEPELTLTAIKGYYDNNNFSYTKAWDGTGKIFTVTLNHNGPVDLVIKHVAILGPAVTKTLPNSNRCTIRPRRSMKIVLPNGQLVEKGFVEQLRYSVSRVYSADGIRIVVYGGGFEPR